MADGDTMLTSVERAFAVVDYLREVESAGVTEVARGLDIPTSTAHTHLTTLEQLGYIVKRDGSYYVGLRFLELGESARNRRDIYDLTRGEVEQLANETGELVGVMIEEHGQGVYPHRSRGDRVALADTRGSTSTSTPGRRESRFSLTSRTGGSRDHRPARSPARDGQDDHEPRRTRGGAGDDPRDARYRYATEV
jgi:DNA-binding transcriptional ArsR family regulator